MGDEPSGEGTRLARALPILMTKRTLASACVIVALLTTGCTPNPEVRLYSRLTRAVVIAPQEREPCVLPPGGTCIFRFSEWLRVREANRETEYRLPGDLRHERSHEFVERRPISRLIIRLQLEEDGRISILPAGKDGPREPGRQRKDFPLYPNPVRAR